MIQRKICMLGATAVGKTSLVSRYVRNMFSDRYLSSIGVRIDKKALLVDGRNVTLVLWDIYGDDQFQSLRPMYLRGAAGYLLVVDGTRPTTLDKALDLKRNVEQAVGALPFVLVLNKSDLTDAWELTSDTEAGLTKSWNVVRSSAKTGQGVEEAFGRLTRAMI